MATELLHGAAMLLIRQSATEMAMANESKISFFEKYKTFIIGAAIGLPLQIVGGWYYLRCRKQKKAKAALEKENLEVRLKELELGLGSGSGSGSGSAMRPAVPAPPIYGQSAGYEQQAVYAGGKI